MSNEQKITVIIADDHPLVRHGIKAILNATDRYTVIAETGDASETVALMKEQQPQILILDIGFPHKSGIEVIYELQDNGLNPTIVILTMHDSEIIVKQALAAGVSAFLSKDFAPEELVQALDKAIQGEITLPNKFQNLLTQDNTSKTNLKNDPLNILSNREREVYFLIAEGIPNREIAQKLNISTRTVETHRARVQRKLGIKSTAELIKYGIKNNVLMP